MAGSSSCSWTNTPSTHAHRPIPPRRRKTPPPTRLRTRAVAAHERLLELRDFAFDHLHSRGRHHVVPRRAVQRGRGEHRAGLAVGLPFLVVRRGDDGAGGERVSDGGRAVSLGQHSWRTRVRLGDGVVQSRRPRHGARGRQRRNIRLRRRGLRCAGECDHARAPHHGRRADDAVARVAESLRHSAHHAAHGFQRLVDSRGRGGAHDCAVVRDEKLRVGAVVDVHELQRTSRG